MKTIADLRELVGAYGDANFDYAIEDCQHEDVEAAKGALDEALAEVVRERDKAIRAFEGRMIAESGEPSA